MQANKKKFLVTTALVVLFLLPGILANWFFHHPEWLQAMKTNKGELLQPPYQLTSDATTGKWHLYYWHPGRCGTDCQQYIDRLARVRLALGRRLYQVELQWLLSPNSPEPAPELIARLAEADIQILRLNDMDTNRLAAMQEKDGVFIANSKNYIVLSYGELNKPMDIYNDLKQLLKVSRENGGGHA